MPDDITYNAQPTSNTAILMEKVEGGILPEHIAQVLRLNDDDSIVIVENDIIKEIKKSEDVHKSVRGFNVLKKEASGKPYMQYVKTVLIKTRFVRKGGGRAESPVDAVGAITTYYDKDGQVLRSDYGVIEWEDASSKTSNSTAVSPSPVR